MALYFCSGMLQDPEQFRHYALNVPLYTHFTSPIRRFPDIVVHRLLAAALGKGHHSECRPVPSSRPPPPEWVPGGCTAVTVEVRRGGQPQQQGAWARNSL